MTKEEQFQKWAKEIDAIECPAFALWLLLPLFEQIVERQMKKGGCENKTYETLAHLKYAELKKAAEEIRDIVADELW